MSMRRTLLSLLALSVVVGLLPASGALAARNKAPRIVKALMKDKDGDGKADRVVLTYNEKIKHKLDTSRFPFRVQGYKIKKINAARGSLRLVIMLRENANAPAKPSSIKYTRTRKQPVLDLKKLQAQKQLLTKNITGLAVTPPPPPPTEEFTLTVSKGGDGLGTVSDNSSKINCGPACTAKYPKGTSVTLTAAPDSASKATFASWTGCTSTTTTCTITMDADKTVTATFSKAGTFLLTVAKPGSGTGTVTSTSNPSPTGQAHINCGSACTASYAKDTVVTLTATADQASQSLFAGWSGDATCSTSTTCTVTMDAAKTVNATFNKAGSFVLTVNKAGTGTVTSSSAPSQTSQINCGSICTATYPAAAQVTLTAQPDQASGATFSGWSGDATCGATTTCTITMDKTKTVTATFAAAAQRTLTVTPTGSGTVTSTSPSQADGINCGGASGDCTAKYTDGTMVTLAAAPATGFKFDGWGGGATCGTASTCQVLMDGDKAVTATFSSVGTGPVMHQLTVNVVSDGTVTCVTEDGPAASCTALFEQGTEVTITAAVTPPALTAALSGDCTMAATPGVAICSVTMTAPKTVTATFAGSLSVGLGMSQP